MNTERSRKLFEEAQRYLPGGVDSPVRAFKAVGGHPLFIKRGQGSRIYDEDDNEYIDYVCSWGPLISGHAHHQITGALQKVIDKGTSFGAAIELEITLAKRVCAAVRSIEMVRFVNSGTEATMSALRLARAFTGRDKIVKFEGCYHGHSDGLLAKAGSGLATLGISDSPGVPSGYARDTLVIPYNNTGVVEKLFQHYQEQIAAVIVEPVAANMGVVPPKTGFLETLRKLTKEYGALLIFDEVITGFRLAYGGAQALYGVTPDLTCLGKVIGGGLPVGAYGGRQDIMQMIAPVGPVYQAGTLSGNPLAMTAGIEMLNILNQPGVYKKLEAMSSALESGIITAASGAGIPMYISRVGSILTAFFTDEKSPVVDYDSAKRSDTQRFAQFFQSLLAEGIYWPPSQYEAAFVSLAHTGEDIQITVEAIKKALNSI
ncbi:glutamate-1-semialdehyde 2,1-aminomutase [Chloroflexota bacterium]